MLKADSAVLVVIDIQGKLATVVHEHERVIDNASRLLRGVKVLGIPVLCTEQNPQGLGPTAEAIAAFLDAPTITKFAFSCCGEKAFLDALAATGRRQVILCGIETHVCVYQTALDLLAAGYEVYVAADAVSSRSSFNRDLALNVMQAAGATLTCVEMSLFEMLRVAGGEKFKQLIRIVK